MIKILLPNKQKKMKLITILFVIICVSAIRAEIQTISTHCYEDVDCDDGIDCTMDTCNHYTRICIHTPKDSVCDNGLFCDGVETCDKWDGCQAGTSPPCYYGEICDERTDSCVAPPSPSPTCAPQRCDDGIDCTIDYFDADTCECVHIPSNVLCMNGRFCDGAEICVPDHPNADVAGCIVVAVPDCDDGIDCTRDTCDERTNMCINTPIDAFCDNGLFCDGLEICDPLRDCRSIRRPCPPYSPCDERSDTCQSPSTTPSNSGTPSTTPSNSGTPSQTPSTASTPSSSPSVSLSSSTSACVYDKFFWKNKCPQGYYTTTRHENARGYYHKSAPPSLSNTASSSQTPSTSLSSSPTPSASPTACIWPIPDDAFLLCGLTWRQWMTITKEEEKHYHFNIDNEILWLIRQWISAQLNIKAGAPALQSVEKAIINVEQEILANCTKIIYHDLDELPVPDAQGVFVLAAYNGGGLGIPPCVISHNNNNHSSLDHHNNNNIINKEGEHNTIVWIVIIVAIFIILIAIGAIIAFLIIRSIRRNRPRRRGSRQNTERTNFQAAGKLSFNNNRENTLRF